MKCEICGTVYTPCRSIKRESGKFYWQDHACCVKCASEYMKRIELEKQRVVKKTASRKKAVPKDSVEE